MPPTPTPQFLRLRLEGGSDVTVYRAIPAHCVASPDLPPLSIDLGSTTARFTLWMNPSDASAIAYALLAQVNVHAAEMKAELLAPAVAA